MDRSVTARVRSDLYGACRVRSDDRIVIGVSGGIDSVFLLTLLYEMKQPLIAAVFDHGLRPEAAEECAFVQAFCAERGIPCRIGAADVDRYAAENGLGIEEAARLLRYRFLFQTAADEGCSAVATAHHANDQAETVLMHLLRGSGIDGLGGIRPYTLPNAFSDTIPLIRPLLGISRAEIEAYAAENGMPYREDRSNSDPSYTRNRIRLDLIPKLEADYNPRIVQSLCRLAENAAADNDVLENECGRAADYMGLRFRENGAEWSRRPWGNYPDGLRLRLLRRIITRLVGADAEIGFINLKEADEFFLHGRYNQTVPFSGGFYLRCREGKAEILKDSQEEQWKYPQMAQGWKLSVSTRRALPKELPSLMEEARRHPEIAFLDADQLADVPYLRRIRPGERFQPYGNRGRSQKISDFLINSKVPAEYRRDLAAAADGGGIIWIPGLRVSHRCALTVQTTEIMVLRLEKEFGDNSTDTGG